MCGRFVLRKIRRVNRISPRTLELRIVGNKTIPTSQIVNQIQTRRGRPFDPKIVQRDIRKLASLSWFVDVKPLYEKTPEGRIVIFQVVERPTIRYIEFLGNQRIRDKTLTKEIGLKVGGAVDPFAVEDGRRGLHVQGDVRRRVRIVDLNVLRRPRGRHGRPRRRGRRARRSLRPSWGA